MTREEAITALGDRNNLLWGMSKEEQKYYSEALDMAISALKVFEGMTHRDVLKALFPIDENKGARLTKVYLDHEPIESFALTTTQKWLDSPYKRVSE